MRCGERSFVTFPGRVSVRAALPKSSPACSPSRNCFARLFGKRPPGSRPALFLGTALVAVSAVLAIPSVGPASDTAASRAATAPRDLSSGESPPKPRGGAEAVRVNQPAELETPTAARFGMSDFKRDDALRSVQTVALFGLISLAPAALLMVTAFVRINVVLILLRQALGSPQVPGNQILTALALLLTALVMRPMGEKVYHEAIQPYAAGRVSAAQAWAAGTQPIKAFMIDQIVWTKHQDYLQALQEYALAPGPSLADAVPVRAADFPLRVVAPAYLLSELTTALLMGFYIYLPFLVIDLVVSSVLAATGLFMLPPALVATPVKLIVFVLADGWLLIATVLLSSFAVPGGP
jgi:flagellar biosynthesis protein FliP